MRSILLFCCAAVLLVSCSEYQKVLKETDVKAKYDMAEKLYEEGDYKRAVRLFEQIAPQYVGKPQGERVMFFFADSYFKNEEYYLAGYQFERSYYMLSPRYSLDQTETDKALLKLQTFINNYSESEFFEEANTMARELTAKKEKKEIEIAKQFNKLGEFNLPVLISAITAFDNFITDNPGSIYREEAMFYRIESATRLALNSTLDKKQERLEDALESYNTLMRYFPETEFKKKADDYAETIREELSAYDTASLSK